MPLSSSRVDEKENTAEEPSTIVYLGENASYIPDSNLSTMGISGSSAKAATRPMQRSVSNGVALSTPTPLMIGMPRQRSYIELGDSLENIPHFSWIFPFIIACSPPEFIQLLRYITRLFITPTPKISSDLNSRNMTNSLNSRIQNVTPRSLGKVNTLFRENINMRGPVTCSVPSRMPIILGIDSTPINYMDDISTPTRRNSESGVITFPRSYSPPAIAHIDLPSTWRSLGSVRVFNNSWKNWESRLLYLLDNFLLECDNEVGGTILGFAPLSSAIVERVPLNNLMGSCGEYSLKDELNLTSSKVLPPAALKISVYKSTFNRGGEMHTFWLSLERMADLNTLEAVLLTASRLTLDDIYTPAAAESLIGTGRYNEVHITRKRANRPLIIDEYLKPRETNAKLRNSVLNRFRSDSADSIDSLDKVYHDGREGFEDEEEEENEREDKDNKGPNPESVQEANSNAIAKGEDLETRNSEASTSSEGTACILREVPSDPPSPSDANLLSATVRADLGTVVGSKDPPQSEVESDLCAVKCISTKRFWMRVGNIQERADTLVREVLAQVLLSSHFLSPNSLSKLRDNISSQNYFSHFSQDIQTLPSIISEESRELPIVQLLGVFETMDDFSLELELMESIDLQEHLIDLQDEGHPGYLEEIHVRQIISQIVDAVSLCNRIGIAHRDIKLPNIMLPRNCERYTTAYKNMKVAERRAQGQEQEGEEDTDDSYFAVKLADFGMAGFVCGDRKIKGRCGTPGFIAPDIMRSDKKEGYSLNVDMFSVGVVAYTLLCGDEPFCDDGIYDIMEKNKQAIYDFNAPRWEEVSSDAKNFISRALEGKAEDRINPEESKRHPWLRDFFFNKSSPGIKSPTDRTIMEESQLSMELRSSSFSSTEYNNLDTTSFVSKVLPYSREASAGSDTTVVPSIGQREYVNNVNNNNSKSNRCSIA
eukprot:gene29813-38967_t